MSNMSYCRFANTAQDLSVCLDSLNPDVNENEISEEEIAAGKGMFRRFLAYCKDNNIIEGYDTDGITAVFENHNNEVQE